MLQEISFVGIDVSKTRFDIFIHPSGKRWKTDSTPAQIADLACRILALGPAIVGLEASGGYEHRIGRSSACRGH